jgi:hypothetical protein
MNEPTVIRFERKQAEADVFQCKLVSPSLPKTRSVPSLFDVAAFGGRFPEPPVQNLGNRIYQELCKNAAIKEALGDVLNARLNTIRPIYIDTETVRAESICWEALWEDTKRFLALDQRWPIARRAKADAYIQDADWFAPPLRILAVVSAENYPGKPEWGWIYEAARLAIKNGLTVELQVVTGDANLFGEIERSRAEAAAAIREPRAVPEDPGALDLIIADFKPHIVHFFCHGVVEQNSGWLVIRTGNKNRPLKAAIDKLPSLQKAWLVVLNACDSSVPIGDDAPSMAYLLVTKMGVPFVIGTLAPIDVLDAHKFSEAFYGRLLFKFSEAFNAARPKESITIGWTEALYAARDAIDRKNMQAPERNNQWTLPVLYERGDKFVIWRDPLWTPAPPAGKEPPILAPVPERRKTDPMVIRANMAADLLRSLPPDMPEAIKLALVESILNPKTEQAAAHG